MVHCFRSCRRSFDRGGSLLENGGGGSENAAPVARAIIDAYLMDIEPSLQAAAPAAFFKQRDEPGIRAPDVGRLGGILERGQIWRTLRLDPMLLAIIAVIASFGLVVLYSAGDQNQALLEAQAWRLGSVFAS